MPRHHRLDTTAQRAATEAAGREYGCAPEKAERHPCQTVDRAALAATVALGAGVLIHLFAPLFSAVQAGLLTVMIIAFALATDFLLLPLLLMSRGRPSTPAESGTDRIRNVIRLSDGSCPT